jgi:hypothetical protein
MVGRDSSMAATHAGNVVEDRVYQLMARTDMVLRWKHQKKVGISVPDIGADVSENDDWSEWAAVDITSDIGHVYGKLGLWSSQEVVYIAEAIFDSVTPADIVKSKDAIVGAKAIHPAKLRRLGKEVVAEKAAKQEAFDLERAKRIGEVDQYPTVQDFADFEHGGSLATASRYLRDFGIKRKGMTTVKPRRTKGSADPTALAAARRKARKAKQQAKKTKTPT